jgi:hypothetical protein
MLLPFLQDPEATRQPTRLKAFQYSLDLAMVAGKTPNLNNVCPKPKSRFEDLCRGEGFGL